MITLFGDTETQVHAHTSAPKIKIKEHESRRINLLRTKVPTKKRRIEQPYLFNGTMLNYKVHKIQYATQIVGEVFEKLSHAVVGRKWHRLVPENWADVRPDLGTEDGLNYIESKASQHRLKVTTHQLSNYVNLVEDHAKLSQHCNVVYFLWNYGHKKIRLVEDGKTVGGLINLLVNNVKSLHIVHWTIIEAMRKKLPENVSFNSYDSWKVAALMGRPFEVLQFGEPFLKRLRADPAGCLRDELKLDPALYDLTPNYRRRKTAECTIDGCDFGTCSFKIHRFVPNSNYIPFPKHFNKSEIPF